MFESFQSFCYTNHLPLPASLLSICLFIHQSTNLYVSPSLPLSLCLSFTLSLSLSLSLSLTMSLSLSLSLSHSLSLSLSLSLNQAQTHVIQDMYNPSSADQYLVCISTGVLPGSGTDANVGFLLVGELGSHKFVVPEGSFCYSVSSLKKK